MEAIHFPISKDLSVTFYHLYQNHLWLSPHPEDSIEARWGLKKCDMILSQMKSARNSIAFIERTYRKKDPKYADFSVRQQRGDPPEAPGGMEQNSVQGTAPAPEENKKEIGEWGDRGRWGKFQITNSKSQINLKPRYQMTTNDSAFPLVKGLAQSVLSLTQGTGTDTYLSLCACRRLQKILGDVDMKLIGV